MSTFTPRLQLKRNDGSDPFLRQDFVDNWNKLDAAPGVYVCTTSSLPTWTTAQAGRLVYQTDAHRFLEWTGTAFRELLQTTPSGAYAIQANQYVASGATANYTLGTFTISRPTTLTVVTTVRVACQAAQYQGITCGGLIDGTDRTVGGVGANQVIWADLNATQFDHRVLTVLSTTGVQPGSHTIGLRATVNTLSSQQCYVAGISSVVLATNVSL